ncbi:P-loop containing nucleoside triphosphate hydrolases superfamily protein [Theobroma cacao]|uniref:P-loop containing nucleoside triphosphate hydrolases superfamily protein n=1 Tax=Theobroma cacao TaxID=3641 RepID=A0A061FV91_THECC|nr:P-loop containing nucleoside triphosphate hydrolases superfamily protein [Theobroma cacao]
MDYYGIKITGGQGQSSLKPTLCGHQKPVLTVSWSPDDSQILTCGQEEGMRPWDVMAVSELSRLRTFLEMENVPVRRLIVNQILHPSASDCKFCAVKRKHQMRALNMIHNDPELSSLKLNQAPLVDMEIGGAPALKIVGDIVYGNKQPPGTPVYPPCPAETKKPILSLFTSEPDKPALTGEKEPKQQTRPQNNILELKPKTCRGGANYNLTGETWELEGRLRGGRYRDGRQGLVVAGRDPDIGGHGWSEGEVPCFSVLVPSRNFHSKADQETIRSSATKFQI